MAEDTAKHISDLLRTLKYGRLVLNGISLGGNVGADALTQLDSNRTLKTIQLNRTRSCLIRQLRVTIYPDVSSSIADRRISCGTDR